MNRENKEIRRLANRHEYRDASHERRAKVLDALMTLYAMVERDDRHSPTTLLLADTLWKEAVEILNHSAPL